MVINSFENVIKNTIQFDYFMAKNLIATEASLWDSVTRKIGISAITGYQKYISPYKGFACAHRVLYGSESCSQYVKRIIIEEGLKTALVKSRSRFKQCKQANLILRSQAYRQELPITTNSHQRQNQRRRNTDKSGSCDYSGVDCFEIGCNCPDLVDITPDCDCMDCGSLDCGSFLDCGGCG